MKGNKVAQEVECVDLVEEDQQDAKGVPVKYKTLA
jgi:hypothetical protein